MHLPAQRVTVTEAKNFFGFSAPATPEARGGVG
jgi:hypothetical protein